MLFTSDDNLIARYDDIGTRKELYELLSNMSDRSRLAFLKWAADRSTTGLHGEKGADWLSGGGVKNVVRSETLGGLEEVYNDLCHLMVRGLPISVVMDELARRARLKRRVA